MKRKRLPFLLLALLLMAVGARAEEIMVNDGTASNNQVPIYGFNADSYTASQFIIPSAQLTGMTGQYVKKMTFYAAADKDWGAATFKVFLSEVDEAVFITGGESLAYDWDNLSLVFEGSLSIVGKEMKVEFDAPFNYEGGNLLVGFRQMTKGSYGSCTWAGVSATNAAIWGYNGAGPEAVSFQTTEFVPKVMFEYSNSPSICKKPTNLAVSGIKKDGATLSWTSDADKWELSYLDGTTGDQGFLEYEGEPSFFFSCPNEGTTYTVKIRAICDENNKSDWSEPIQWTTTSCEEEDMCAISYELGDEYGDGWSGNAIQVIDQEKGSILATWTIANGNKETGILEVCPGRMLDFKWVVGSYGYECSFKIFDANGEIILQHDADTAPEEGLLGHYLVDCTVETDCLTPADFEVSEVTAKSAVLSWTEKGTSTSWKVTYQVENDNHPTVVDANENPFTLTGLQPETTYLVFVSPTCNENKQSSTITFTTSVACLAPEGLAAEPDLTSATISWTGYSDNYNVRYKKSYLEGDFEDGTLGGWTTIRNGQGDVNTDWQVVKANIYLLNNVPLQAPSGEYVIVSKSFYNWQGYQVDNWLISPKVKLDGTLSFWVMDDGSYHDHYDVYVSTTDKNIESFTLLAEPGDATSEWTQVTVDLSSFQGQVGYIALRHQEYDQDMLLFDNFTIELPGEDLEWTTLTTSEESIEITGLAPETTYKFEVQGICEEYESKWTSGSFTTLEACPVPYNIAVEVENTTATVTWSGNSENYNVRYRIPATREQIFFEGFENGLGEWTTIDADEDGNNWSILDNVDVDVYGNPRGFDNKYANSASYVNNPDGWGGTALTPDNWLISPELDLQGTMSVWLRGQDPDWAGEHFAIYLSTNGKAVEDFTTVLVPETVANDVMTEYTADLSQYEGRKGYIAIRHFNITDMFSLNVDNFAILSEEKAGTDWQTITTDETTAEITGLMSGATYELQVQGVCDNEPTEWSNVVTFNTSLGLVLLDNDYDQPEGSKNPDLLASVLNQKVDVILKDRVFYKDREWNTLCLPFSLSEEEIANSPLDGAIIKVLTYANVTGRHVDMSFTTTDKIEAGNYYIFKWENGGENIVSPVFDDVIIELAGDSSSDETDDSHFQVVGNFTTMIVDPAKDNHYSYYLGAGNKLRYSDNPVTLHTFRLFFVLHADANINPGTVEFNLNFDDSETDGIVEIDGTTLNANAHEGIFNLQGVKLSEQPQQKGVFIMNGRKVVVK